jgi:hypothetical protein
VSVGDDLEEVRALLELDGEARRRERAVVVGAGFAPGLTCVLASHAAAAFDVVDEVHVAKVGTAGPACAETHHRALAGEAVDWRAGEWVSRAGGSGHGAFPGAARITARMGATRRDRLTARLPMLRKPHPEGTIGAVRVEVRGRRGGACEVEVLGAIDRPGVAAGCVAAVAGIWALEERLERWGAGGLAELVSPVPFLAELARRGVKAAVFDGASA